MNVKYFLSFSSPLFTPNPQFPIEELLLYAMAGDICIESSIFIYFNRRRYEWRRHENRMVFFNSFFSPRCSRVSENYLVVEKEKYV